MYQGTLFLMSLDVSRSSYEILFLKVAEDFVAAEGIDYTVSVTDELRFLRNKNDLVQVAGFLFFFFVHWLRSFQNSQKAFSSDYLSAEQIFMVDMHFFFLTDRSSKINFINDRWTNCCIWRVQQQQPCCKKVSLVW